MLDPGDNVRFRGLGAGQVVSHEKRKFQGKMRVFAVIHFPHSQMNAQIPLGDPDISEKITPVLAKSTLEKMLRDMTERGERLPRTWDAREELGQKALREGGPREWADLLASYARADGAGVSVAASDEELVRSAIENMAAELACAAKKDYLWALERVDAAYERAVEASSTAEPVEHFAAVEIP